MPLRPCLDCGKLSPQSRCEAHRPTNATSWNGTRDRAAQARFRAIVLDNADDQCQALEHGERCSMTAGLQAHHTIPGLDDPLTGVALCSKHHRLVDRHAR